MYCEIFFLPWQGYSPQPPFGDRSLDYVCEHLPDNKEEVGSNGHPCLIPLSTLKILPRLPSSLTVAEVFSKRSLT